MNVQEAHTQRSVTAEMSGMGLEVGGRFKRVGDLCIPTANLC